MTEKQFGTTYGPPRQRGEKTACIVNLQAEIDRQGGVPYGWLRIYEVLLFAFYNPRTGQCFPSHKAIAAKARCGVSTVQRALKWARENGLIIASSEESAGEGERQGWLSTRNLRSFLQVASARQNATFIFGRERHETGENVGHVKFCCNSASEVEDMKHSRLVGLFVTLLGVLALFSSLNKPGVAALRGSEVLGLIGSGMCFGTGFVGLMGKLRVRD